MFAKRIALFGVLALFSACKGRLGEELVAKVNGDGIGKKEFEMEVERNLTRYRGQAHELPPGIEDRIKESVLRRMIDDKVIAQKAKSLGVSVTTDELNAKMDEHKKRFRTDEAFKAYLERSNNTEANIRADLERNLLRDRVVEKLSGAVDVSADEVKQYYTENLDRFKDKEQIRAARIMLRIEDNMAEPAKKALRKHAVELRAKLAKGGKFDEVAKKESKGPEAANGGDLGWFTRGRFAPEFDEAAFKLGVNQMSGVIDTKLGYEIVKVFEKKPERQKPLEEVEAMIRQSLDARKHNQKRRDVLRTLKSETKVEQLVQFEKPGQGAPEAGAPAGGEPNAPAPAAAPAAPAAPAAQAAPAANPAAPQ